MHKLLIFLFCFLITNTFSAYARNSFELHLPAKDNTEGVLRIEYKIHCLSTDSKNLPIIPGKVEIYNKSDTRSNVRTLFFFLFDKVKPDTNGYAITEISLGSLKRSNLEAKVIIEDQPLCTIESLQPPHLVSIEVASDQHNTDEALALQHSPFLSIRYIDQRPETEVTDLPVFIMYDVFNDSLNKTKIIQYTVVFTDEDSKHTIADTNAQMARYGRRTDIEWLYRVTLDSKNQVLSREYQSSAFSLMNLAIIHSTNTFRGEFLPNSEHPILYNIYLNNVFTDIAPKGFNVTELGGYHLVPRTKVSFPDAREKVLFDNPWIFYLSDQELFKENKLDLSSQDYLYVLIEAKSDEGLNGSVQARISFEDSTQDTVFYSGNKEGDVDRLGEDMWHRQAYTAIPIGADLIAKIEAGHAHGTLDFVSSSYLTAGKLTNVSLRFFKVTSTHSSYESQEIKSVFKYSSDLNAWLF